MDSICICKICKQPVSNFICTDCIAENMEERLPARFSRKVASFNSRLNAYFSSVFDGMGFCLKCKNEKPTSMCMHCFITEFLMWAKDENPSVLKYMVPLLNYDFDKHEEQELGKTIPITGGAAIYANNGNCEMCDEYSDELHFVNGGWLCNECTESVLTD